MQDKKDDLIRLAPARPHQEFNVIIPLGVSINHLYMFKKGRRFMTKKGMDYMRMVGEIAMRAVERQSYELEEEGVWLVCELTYYFPDKRRRDCHNLHKIVMDALEHIAFKEDRWLLVRDMHVGLDKECPRIEVRIYPQAVDKSVDKEV